MNRWVEERDEQVEGGEEISDSFISSHSLEGMSLSLTSWDGPG